jgi:putative membrane protein
MYRALTVAFAIAAVAGVSRAATDDTEFMKEAASGGAMEVELGQYAAENAASSDVKEFGRRMVEDHGKANKELKQLATQKGVTLPAAMSEDHGEQAHDLMELKGAEFDKEYMRHMVKDHEKDVSAFREQAEQGKSDVDRWAEKTLPTLTSHLEQAKQIHGRLEGSSTRGTGSETDVPTSGMIPGEKPRPATP